MCSASTMPSSSSSSPSSAAMTPSVDAHVVRTTGTRRLVAPFSPPPPSSSSSSSSPPASADVTSSADDADASPPRSEDEPFRSSSVGVLAPDCAGDTTRLLVLISGNAGRCCGVGGRDPCRRFLDGPPEDSAVAKDGDRDDDWDDGIAVSVTDVIETLRDLPDTPTASVPPPEEPERLRGEDARDLLLIGVAAPDRGPSVDPRSGADATACAAAAAKDGRSCMELVLTDRCKPDCGRDVVRSLRDCRRNALSWPTRLPLGGPCAPRAVAAGSRSRPCCGDDARERSGDGTRDGKRDGTRERGGDTLAVLVRLLATDTVGSVRFEFLPEPATKGPNSGAAFSVLMSVAADAMYSYLYGNGYQ